MRKLGSLFGITRVMRRVEPEFLLSDSFYHNLLGRWERVKSGKEVEDDEQIASTALHQGSVTLRALWNTQTSSPGLSPEVLEVTGPTLTENILKCSQKLWLSDRVPLRNHPACSSEVVLNFALVRLAQSSLPSGPGCLPTPPSHRNVMFEGSLAFKMWVSQWVSQESLFLEADPKCSLECGHRRDGPGPLPLTAVQGCAEECVTCAAAGAGVPYGSLFSRSKEKQLSRTMNKTLESVGQTDGNILKPCPSKRVSSIRMAWQWLERWSSVSAWLTSREPAVQPSHGQDEDMVSECENNVPEIRSHRSKGDFTSQKSKSAEVTLLCFVYTVAGNLKPFTLLTCVNR